MEWDGAVSLLVNSTKQKVLRSLILLKLMSMDQKNSAPEMPVQDFNGHVQYGKAQVQGHKNTPSPPWTNVHTKY